MEKKDYNLYLHVSDLNTLGFYRAKFIGEAKGNIDTGVQVISNSTGGVGNVTGYVHAQKIAIFQFIFDEDVFISTDGTNMTFQNILGENAISFIQGYLEFILQYEIRNLVGNEYEGETDDKKAYIVKFDYGDDKTARATMTNCGMC
jgi:hypothetical protein